MTDLLNFRPIIPMGAVLIKEGMEKYINDPNYIGEVKYDGFRLLGWFEKDHVRYTTRSVGVESIRAGKPMPTERTNNIPHLRDLKHDLYGTILDGECWKPGCTSHDITSMIGGLPETSIANQEREGWVMYIIYDILQFKGINVEDLPYYKRRELLEKEIYPHLIKMNPEWADYLALSEIVPQKYKITKYEELVAAGGEGMILKHKLSKYYEGKIDKNGKGQPSKVKANKRKGIPHTPWVKWKKKDTFDCVIMGFAPATAEYTGNELATWQYWEAEDGTKLTLNGVDEAVKYQHDYGIPVRPITKFYYYGWPGAIIFGQYDKNGNLVEVGNTSGIPDELRAEFAKDPDKYIGRVIEVEAMERIKKTKALREPRFKRFRDDKNPFECIIE